MLTITISGPQASGKTELAHLIAELCNVNGLHPLVDGLTPANIRRSDRRPWTPHIDILTTNLPSATDVAGWIVGDADGSRWRGWADGNSCWTFDRDKATRYARREDAEAVHREDEDAWRVVPYSPEPLCDDEGCDHFGVPHVCVSPQGNIT